jgi:hypothetical protein
MSYCPARIGGAVSPFEHLSVLISIIIGLAIARVLSRAAVLVQAHQRVRPYWLLILWAVLLFIVQVEWWWASFEFRAQMEWNFFFFIFILMSPVMLYLAATFILPELKEGESCDLKDHYFRECPWFYSLIAAGTMFDAVRRGLVAGFDDFGAVSNAVSAVLVISMAVSKSELYHTFISILLASVFLLFIVSSALQLG